MKPGSLTPQSSYASRQKAEQAPLRGTPNSSLFSAGVTQGKEEWQFRGRSLVSVPTSESPDQGNTCRTKCRSLADGRFCPHPTSGFTSHREQSPKADVTTVFLIQLTCAHSCCTLATVPHTIPKRRLWHREPKPYACAQAPAASSDKKGPLNSPHGLRGRCRSGGQEPVRQPLLLPKTHQDPSALEEPL